MTPALCIRDLTVEFATEFGVSAALRGVSFDVPRGQVTALVGESGSGKSVTAGAVMRLIQPPGRVTGGSVRFSPGSGESFEILALADGDPRLYDLRGGHISLVFQEPMTALSPVHRVGDQVAEAILCHRRVSRRTAWQEAVDMLGRVGIPDAPRRAETYPFQLSGGMQQRVMIAMALVCGPELLICDEPTTALDVTVQAEILTLIRDLQSGLGNSVLFITHDLGVVAQVADHVVVMFQGRVLEIGTVRQVLKDPVHPYTRGLLAAIPGTSRPRGAAGDDRERGRRRRPDHAAAVDHPRRRPPGELAATRRFTQGAHVSGTLLEVRNLDKAFDAVPALTDVSFDLERSATLGVVGESGSGKTTLARCILRAVAPDSGTVRYASEGGWVNLHELREKALIPLRREIQMVFQDPYGSLNPRMTVRQILEEPLIIHRQGNAQARHSAVVEMLRRVHLEPDALSRYPHAFSGGQRQRISIARSLILRPRLVVCDEAVSALDVSVRAQIINLLGDLQAELGLTYMFIAHDLSVVRHLCDSVLVMYRGRIVERGAVRDVFENPRHDYTRLLLSAIPSTDPDVPLRPLDRRELNL